MCPRCGKSHSNQLTFNIKPQKFHFVAYCCKVCGYLWSTDEEQLRAVRKHLKWMTDTRARDTLDK